MVSGPLAVLYLLICVTVIILLTSKLKMNAFIVLLFVTFSYGIAVGIPLDQIIKNIRDGFGGTLGYIGIVIIAGTIIGTILEKTGAALSMTNAILKLVGKERSPLAMSMAGYTVSIPVFCDSGFVLLTPLNKALAYMTKKSMSVMAIALATGLYATHCLVPPTPGPIAATGILGANLGKVLFLGIVVSIPAMLAGYFWATRFASRYEISPNITKSYEELVEEFGELPSAFASFLPLVVPIVLILGKSLANPKLGWITSEKLSSFLNFIGDPVIALFIGILLSLFLVKKEMLAEATQKWVTEGIRHSALILAITGAGGAFGAILKASPMGKFLGDSLSTLNMGIFLPFAIAAALKTAQGSSTVAIITTSSIMAPLLAKLGLDPSLTVLAIGAGAMTVSHANDSFFWVVSQFSEMEVSIAYKTYTTATLVLGIVSITIISVLALVI